MPHSAATSVAPPVSSSAATRRILAIALPIIGGMLSQNVLNLVDTAMVGTLGDAALAAVGMASFCNFLSTAFITGMSAGVQATAARRVGEGRRSESAIALNGGLLLAAGAALPWSIFLIGLVPDVFPLLVDDPEVAGLGASYLSIRLMAMVAVGMNFAFRGYWNAVELSRLYMGTLAIMHALNIFLNWTLIYGNLGMPEMGVEGAAIGTAISTCFGTVLYAILGFRHARSAGFLKRLPDREAMGTMVRLCLPAGLQQFSFAAGMTALFVMIARLGTAELAAANVLLNWTLVTTLPSIGFGLAASTLVGQSLGAGSTGEASAWAWRVATRAMVGVALLAIPAWAFPDAVLGVFLHDPETLALARGPLRLVGLLAPLETLSVVLMQAHHGAGSSRRVLLISGSMQWLLMLPCIYVVGPLWQSGLLAVWAVQAAFRVLTMLIFVRSWHSGSWATARV